MLINAVNDLKSRQKELRAQIQSLEKELRHIQRAIALLSSVTANGKAPAAPRKRRKMSRLGQLRIKLGALNRYGHKEEAKKVQTQIDALLAKQKA